MSQVKSYASFNALTVTGRIAASEIVSGRDNDFLSVTVYSTCSNDGETIAYTFTNSNGLLALARKGGLPVGREITLTGHINGIKAHYKNKDTGAYKLLNKPEVKLTSVQILDGGLGRMPQTAQKSESVSGVTLTIDEAPAFGASTKVDELGIPVL